MTAKTAAELFALEYTIKFRPGQFYIVPAISEGSAGKHAYYNVVDEKTGRQVGFSVDQNDAQTICLALEFLTATVHGDRDRLRGLVKLIDALKKGAIQ